MPQNKPTPRRQPTHVLATEASTLTSTVKRDPSTTSGAKTIRGKCFNCGIEGRMSRACPYPRKTKRNEEACGHKEGVMSVLVNEEDNVKRIATLKEQLHEAELKMAVSMHTMSCNCLSLSSNCRLIRLM